MTGTVKWFNPKRGYGFINTENGEEIFVHYSAIQGNGFKTLHQKANVSFNIRNDNGKKYAENVMEC